jgi:error-prone DNA polymerase
LPTRSPAGPGARGRRRGCRPGRWPGCSGATRRRWRARRRSWRAAASRSTSWRINTFARRWTPGLTPRRALERLTWEGASARYPEGLPGEVAAILRHELGLISRLAYPLAFPREDRARLLIVSCAEAAGARDGRSLTTAGIVPVRQMPDPGKGVLFVTIEDETGVANLVIWPRLYERQRREIRGARMMGVKGRIQRESAVVHLLAYRLSDLSTALAAGGGQRSSVPPAPGTQR